MLTSHLIHAPVLPATQAVTLLSVKGVLERKSVVSLFATLTMQFRGTDAMTGFILAARKSKNMCISWAN